MSKLPRHNLTVEFLTTNYDMEGLRAIAQAYGITIHPATSKKESAAKKIIEIALTDIAPEEGEKLEVVKPVPVTGNEAEIAEALKEYRDKGLKVKIDGDTWEMKYHNMLDSGNINIPIHAIVNCAKRLMRFGVNTQNEAQKAMADLEAAQERVQELAAQAI